MRLDVFCAWGDGPDVGINIHRTRDEIDRVACAELVPLDFTPAEARELAAKLIACAEQAEAMDRDLEAYEARERARRGE